MVADPALWTRQGRLALLDTRHRHMMARDSGLAQDSLVGLFAQSGTRLPMSIPDASRALLACVLALLLAPAAGAVDVNQVEQGRRLFFTETFQGNGRTCGACHPADNNYTIDPAYIARLPATDPLFVKVAGVDNPTLLRQRALVTVHADGFDKPGVLRGVPTLLGIGRS